MRRTILAWSLRLLLMPAGNRLQAGRPERRPLPQKFCRQPMDQGDILP